MYTVNDCVFYKTVGICRITAIRAERIGRGEAQPCYVLKPVYNPNTTLYIPMEQDDLVRMMRPILTKEEIVNLISYMPDAEAPWIENERDRGKDFYEKLQSCDAHEWIKIIKALYQQKGTRKQASKAMNSIDSRIMTAAEKLLHEEFAFVLGIEPSAVLPYILERIPPAAVCSR